MCCDSAHKTLPVLTGGAYLHISKGANERYKLAARQKMNIFCSTSPSYLILQSLDLCNKYIADGFCEDLGKTVEKISILKQKLSEFGFRLLGTEPLKITVDANFSGYRGIELATILRGSEIEPEYADNRFVCMMFSVNNSDADFERIEACFKGIRAGEPIIENQFVVSEIYKKMSIREAVLAESEALEVENSLGRVCAVPAVSCPPAVPIVISGEEITAEHIELFKNYNIKTVEVVV
jgi:arginine/lysine/ornithine decarboxylase